MKDIIDEAKEEWVIRGLDLAEFSMPKMVDLWEMEEEEKLTQAQQKKEAKKLKMQHAPPQMHAQKSKARQNADVVVKVIKKESTALAKATWTLVEPRPLQRKRLLTEHIQRINVMNAECTQYQSEIQKVTKLYLDHHEEELLENSERKKRLQSKGLNSKILHKMKLKEAKIEQKKRLREMAKKRLRWKKMEEQERAAFLEDQARLDVERIRYQRSMDVRYWKDKERASIELLGEIEAKEQATKAQLQEDAQTQHQSEKKLRADQDFQDQFGEPKINTNDSKLGIFGTPLEPGEFASKSNGGHQSGLDEHSIGIPTTGPHRFHHELERMELMEIESQVTKYHEMHDDLHLLNEKLRHEREFCGTQRTHVEQELRGLEDEEREQKIMLEGPPRQNLTPAMQEASLIRMKCRTKAKARLLKLKHREKQLGKYQQQNQQQLEKLRHEIQEAEQLASARREALEQDLERGGNELPMIVGQSLTKIPAITSVYNPPAHNRSSPLPLLPPQTVALIQHQSEFQILKAASKPVLKVFQESRKLRLDSWQMKGQYDLDAAEFERTLNRLARVKDQIMASKQLERQDNLITALDQFHQSQESLTPVQKTLEGQLNWWALHVKHHQGDPNGVQRGSISDTQIMTLQDGATLGYIAGKIDFPSYGNWRIEIKLIPTEREEPQKMGKESIHVQMGITERSLKSLGTYYAWNGDTNTVEDDQIIVHNIVGKSGFFSFEFQSSGSVNAQSHLALLVGEYQVQTEAEELTTTTSNHFVSDFVELLRVQELQSNHRITKLLEELISSEESSASHVDSRIFHQYRQRFPRHEYIQIVREEIKKEIGKTIDAEIERQQEAIRRNEELGLPRLVEEPRPGPTFLLSDRPNSHSSNRPTSHSSDRPTSHNSNRPNSHNSNRPNSSNFNRPNSHNAQSRALTQAAAPENNPHPIEITQQSSKLEQSRRNQLELRQNLRRTTMTQLYPIVGRHYKVLVTPPNGWVLYFTQEIRFEWRNDAKSVDSPQLRVLEWQSSTGQYIDTWTTFDSSKWVMLPNAVVKAFQHQLRQRHAAQEREVLEVQTYQLEQKIRLHQQQERRVQVQHERQIAHLAQQKHKSLSLMDKDPRAASKYTKAQVEHYWDQRSNRHEQARVEAQKADERQYQEELNQSQAVLAALVADPIVPAVVVPVIPDFERATSQGPPCTHDGSTKSWGNAHGTGIRCLKCQKELSTSHLDPHHHHGVDWKLDQKVKAHRMGQYHVESSADLARVEAERVRLEKERYVMATGEIQFYDHVNLQSMERLDQRHRATRGTTTSPSETLKTRETLDTHVVAYREEIQFCARVHQFRRRMTLMIEEQMQTVEQLSHIRAYAELLVFEGQKLEQKLPEIERDHATVEGILAERKRREKILKRTKSGLKSALVDRDRARAEQAEKNADAVLSETTAQELKVGKSRMETTLAWWKMMRDRVKIESKHVKETWATLQQRQPVIERQTVAYLLKKRGQVVQSPYGRVKILAFRSVDNMVVVQFVDRSYIQASVRFHDFVQVEQQRMEAERVGMVHMEMESKAYYALERTQLRRHCREMHVEEYRLTRWIQWEGHLRKENQDLNEAVRGLEIEHFGLLSTPKVQAQLKEHVGSVVESMLGAMPSTSLFDKTKFKLKSNRIQRALRKRISMNHIEQQVLVKEHEIRTRGVQARNEITQNQVLETFYDQDLLHEILIDLVTKVKQQDNIQSRVLQCQAGVVAHPTTYEIKNRHEFVTLPSHGMLQLEQLYMRELAKRKWIKHAWSRQHDKLGQVQEQLAIRKAFSVAQEHQRQVLRSRQLEMRTQERECRTFYRQEFKLMLDESRLMYFWEMDMRELVRLEQLARVRASFMKEYDDSTGTQSSSRETRRLEIKKGKNEMKHQYREWAHIRREDELGKLVREEEVQRARRQALEAEKERQMMLSRLMDERGQYDDQNEDMGQHLFTSHIMMDLDLAFPPDPEDSVLDHSVDDHSEQSSPSKMTKAERREHLLRTRVRAKRRAFRAEKLHAQRQLRHAFDNEYAIATVEQCYARACYDLDEWTCRRERAELRERAAFLDEGWTYLSSIASDKFEEETQISTAAVVKRQISDEVDRRVRDCAEAVEILTEQVTKCQVDRDVYFRHTRTFASSVLHGRPQLFQLEYAQRRLYAMFFQYILAQVAVKAEHHVIVSQVDKLENKLKSLRLEQRVKSSTLERMSVKNVRKARLRLKRSALGQLMFYKSQRLMLSGTFKRWVRYWTDRLTVRSSYALRYSLLRQEQTLHDMEYQPFFQQNQNTTRRKTRATLMQRHQHRWLRCRNCHAKFTEATNTRASCRYHPQEYAMVCTRACRNKQKRKGSSRSSYSIQPECMAHRAKRWLCCDNTDEGLFGSTGCARRFHLPPKGNGSGEDMYERLVVSEQAKEDARVIELDREIAKVDARAWAVKVHQRNRSRLNALADPLEKERAFIRRGLARIDPHGRL